MWILLAIASALGLGVYDIFKKLSLKDNNVLTVLFLNTVFSSLLLCPLVISGIMHGNYGFGNSIEGHLFIIGKAFIVLTSWVLGYAAIKHLPLTITGSINATRPVLVLVGALLIYGEQLNWMQWAGLLLGFSSLFLISRIGAKEGFSIKNSIWLWMIFGATIVGAISGLYDKFLMRRFEPMEVQSWYTIYQCIIMGITVTIIKRVNRDTTPFTWRWTIPFISLFLTLADIAYVNSLAHPDSMISVVSMIRRGSLLVSFIYGAVVLHEKNVKLKLVDIGILLAGLIMLVLGSH